MLKTISAAFIAASLLAAPAMASGPSRDGAPAVKSVTVTKVIHVKPSVANANARMGRHHHRHFHRHHRHHRFHRMH